MSRGTLLLFAATQWYGMVWHMVCGCMWYRSINKWYGQGNWRAQLRPTCSNDRWQYKIIYTYINVNIYIRRIHGPLGRLSNIILSDHVLCCILYRLPADGGTGMPWNDYQMFLFIGGCFHSKPPVNQWLILYANVLVRPAGWISDLWTLRLQIFLILETKASQFVPSTKIKKRKNQIWLN